MNVVNKHITKLRSISDVYTYRMKLFKVFTLIGASTSDAAKFTISIATYLRKGINEWSSLEVELLLGFKDNVVKTQFRFPYLKDEAGLLTSFFDRERIVDDLLSVSKDFVVYSVGAAMDVVARVNVELRKKSKDELARDIKQKKKELDASIKTLEQTTLEKTRLENELSVAKKIQLSMLPLNFSDFDQNDHIRIFAKLEPAREVGGDFYDCYFLDENHVGFAVGDVSGKGVPAALMMAVCKTLLKSKARTDKSTAQILVHTNDEMAKDNVNSMFVTAFMAVLNLNTGKMWYSNAGHCPTYILKKNGVLVKLTELHGPVLAAMEGLVYKESDTILENGDFVFVYSDGITEAHSESKELYSDDRLSVVLRENISNTPKEIVTKVFDDVKSFVGDAEQFDDITALCLKYKS